MDAPSVVLLIISLLTAVILGVLAVVALSLLMTARSINHRLDQLDDNLMGLVSTMENLSESSQAELSQLHTTLAEQQRVHKSIRATSRLVDIVFRKPAVTTAAAREAASHYKRDKRRRKARSLAKKEKLHD